MESAIRMNNDLHPLAAFHGRAIVLLPFDWRVRQTNFSISTAERINKVAGTWGCVVCFSGFAKTVSGINVL